MALDASPSPLPCCRRRLLRCIAALNCSSSTNTRRWIPQSMTWKVPMKVSTSPDSTRFKVHRLCHLVFSQHIPTDVSSRSMADSRDKLHLTRHHPIHAQNFTIKSRSTAQVPRLCFASTCSDVTTGPPFFGNYVMEGHTSSISLVKSRRIN